MDKNIFGYEKPVLEESKLLKFACGSSGDQGSCDIAGFDVD